MVPADLALGQALATAGLGSVPGISQGDIIYRPALYAQAHVAYASSKYGINYERKLAALPSETRGRTVVWDDFVWKNYDIAALHQTALPGAKYTQITGWLADTRLLTALKKDFEDWVYRAAAIQVRTIPSLDISAGPEVSDADFQDMVQKASDKMTQEQLEKLNDAHKKKVADLERNIRRQEQQVESEETELKQRRIEEVGSAGEVVLGFLGIGRKKSVSSSLTKRRLTSQARQDVEEEQAELEDLRKQLEELEAEHTREVTALQQEAAEQTEEITEVPLSPYKKDIFVDLFGIAWCPYYTVIVNGQTRELPAFSVED